MSRNRIVSALALALTPFGLLAVTAGPASAAGVSGPAFYVDHQLYRTVGTPTDLSNTGAPASSFDAIYAFADQRSVAEAAPGDRGFNGGRWQVHSVVVDDYAAALEPVTSTATACSTPSTRCRPPSTPVSPGMPASWPSSCAP